jgi:hypothetical protein
MIGRHDLRVSTRSCCLRQRPRSPLSQPVSRARFEVRHEWHLARGHCSERFYAGNLAQRRVWGKRAPSSSRPRVCTEQCHRHREVVKLQRRQVRDDVWRAKHQLHRSCEHARGIPLGAPYRTAATYGRIGVAPSGPRQRKNCVQLVWITSAQNRAARFLSQFLRMRTRRARCALQENPRVAQVLHKLTEGPRPCSRSLQHIGSDAPPERRWDTPRNAEPGVDMQRMAV